MSFCIHWQRQFLPNSCHIIFLFYYKKLPEKDKNRRLEKSKPAVCAVSVSTACCRLHWLQTSRYLSTDIWHSVQCYVTRPAQLREQRPPPLFVFHFIQLSLSTLEFSWDFLSQECQVCLVCLVFDGSGVSGVSSVRWVKPSDISSHTIDSTLQHFCSYKKRR